MRYTPVAPGREQHELSPDVWREYTEDVARLREQLGRVDPTDRSAWAHVAREASGALAAWSQRIEPDPGPLADASRTLARTAQVRARDARPRKSTGLQSIAGAARLLAMASSGGQGTAAEAMLFRQLMQTIRSVHAMHEAVHESGRARQLAASLGAQLDSVRARLPELVAAPTVPDAAQRAAGGVAPIRSGNPLPTPLNPQRPNVPTTPPDRGVDR